MTYYEKYIKYKTKYLNLKHHGGQSKDYLIITPAGDKSLHTKWEGSKIFDLYVIYFGSTSEIEKKYKENSDFFIKRKGPKWQLIRHVLNNFEWKKYKYIWLPDDDLDISREDVEEFFKVSDKLNLSLSQPSLKPPDLSDDKLYKIQKDLDWARNNSESYIGFNKFYRNNKSNEIQKIQDYISYKLLLNRYNRSQKAIRYSTFVEIMCPLFKTEFLKIAFKFFNKDGIESGFGLDKVWAHVLNYKNIAIIDYISVVHTRPVGKFNTGKKTGNFKVLTDDPDNESKRTISSYLESVSNKKFKYYKNIEVKSMTKPKIALLFLIRDSINYPKVWSKFINQGNDRVNVYIHPKTTNNLQNEFKKYVISRNEETQWGNIGIVKAMNLLLEEALEDASNRIFIFVSESCIPIHNFDYIYNEVIELDKKNKSYFTLGNNTGYHLKRFDYMKQPETKNLGINRENFLKGELWSIICRKHANYIVNTKGIYTKIFDDIYVPDEHYNVTLLNLKFGSDNIINRSTTYTKWLNPNDKHPYTFKDLTKEDKDTLKKEKKGGIRLFARKFKYFEDNDKYLLQLID